jgi:hypothetical protein
MRRWSHAQSILPVDERRCESSVSNAVRSSDIMRSSDITTAGLASLRSQSDGATEGRLVVSA